MTARAAVKIDLSGIRRLESLVQYDLNGPSNGPVRAALRQWGPRYGSFVQLRWTKQSRGGGEWAPLAPSTLKRRRKGKKKKDEKKDKKKTKKKKRIEAAILIDTGTLYNVASFDRAGWPGRVSDDIPFGMRLGYSNIRHPRGGELGKIVMAHHIGARTGRGGKVKLPKREILVKPDSKTAAGMARVFERGMQRAIQACSLPRPRR
jgi:hypothetical protein